MKTAAIQKKRGGGGARELEKGAGWGLGGGSETVTLASIGTRTYFIG